MSGIIDEKLSNKIQDFIAEKHQSDLQQENKPPHHKLTRKDSFVDKAAKFITEHPVAFDLAVGAAAAVGGFFISGPLAPIISPIIGGAAALLAKGIIKVAENRVEHNREIDARNAAADDEKPLNKSKHLDIDHNKNLSDHHTHHAADIGHHGHVAGQSFAAEVGHHGHNPNREFVAEVVDHKPNNGAAHAA